MRPTRTVESPATGSSHASILLGSLGIIVAAFLLQVGADGNQVHLRNVPAARLPELCATRACFNVSCPGCGLTRSLIYLAQGDLLASWQAHRLGWLVAILMLAQIPYRGYEIARPGPKAWARKLSLWLGATLFVAILVNWLLGLWP